MRFSAIYIVYNEEEKIVKSLENISKYTDDIVVFDTESSDCTKALARKYTSKVFTVPYVGCCDSYFESAMLRAKYDWCLLVYPDEFWGLQVMRWIEGLDEIMPEGGVAFLRREFIDSVAFNSNQDNVETWSYHLRLVRRGGIFLCDLLDSKVLFGFDVLRVPDWTKSIEHNKSMADLARGIQNRIVACKWLIKKYSNTKVEQFVNMVSSYKEFLKEEDNDGSK